MSYRVLTFLLNTASHVLGAIAPIVLLGPIWAQSVQRTPPIQPQDIIPPQVPQPRLPEAPIQLPSLEQLLPQPTPQPSPETPTNVPDTIFVRRIEVVGSTVFSAADFDKVTRKYIDRNLTFAELLQVRSEITNLYIGDPKQPKYVTSAAVLPPQTLSDGIVRIQVIEGSVESINVVGTRRLNPNYVRSRIKLATGTPLNVTALLEQLRSLQLDPLIGTISADLQAGTRPGTSILQVTVSEAKTLSIAPFIDNARSPSVGTLRRGLELAQANLLGLGDSLRIGYANTDGSNSLDLSYTIPINPRNGTLRFAYGSNRSRVIEEPFDVLDIQSRSRYYELTYRQPIVQRSTQELALGVTLSHQSSQTELGIDNIGPFPLSDRKSVV